MTIEKVTDYLYWYHQEFDLWDFVVITDAKFWNFEIFYSTIMTKNVLNLMIVYKCLERKENPVTY